MDDISYVLSIIIVMIIITIFMIYKVLINKEVE